MIVVNIVPTGLGAEIGGHAGDATPSAKLLASVCDTLIVHPNVVNASDINEMTENMLYVEGSMLDLFLQGKIHLKRVKSNKILVVVNRPCKNETINAVSAARATIGLDAYMMPLDIPLKMIATKGKNGEATGEVTGWKELCKQVQKYEFDALAIATPIDCAKSVALDYFKNGGVNPWGGIEAIASKLIAERVGVPVAHAPVLDGEITLEDVNFVCDPRMAPEIISQCLLHCVLKGLHKAPRESTEGLYISDVDALVSPAKCWGTPHVACAYHGIPIIGVRGNDVVTGNSEILLYDKGLVAGNYFEAAGYIKAMEIGITIESVLRPLADTEVIRSQS